MYSTAPGQGMTLLQYYCTFFLRESGLSLPVSAPAPKKAPIPGIAEGRGLLEVEVLQYWSGTGTVPGTRTTPQHRPVQSQTTAFF